MRMSIIPDEAITNWARMYVWANTDIELNPKQFGYISDEQQQLIECEYWEMKKLRFIFIIKYNLY